MRYRIADYGTVFSTRDRGARVLVEVLEAYRARNNGEIIVDFEGVRSMTHSFADEFIGELLSMAKRGEVPTPALENLRGTPLRAVERSARVRDLAVPHAALA